LRREAKFRPVEKKYKKGFASIEINFFQKNSWGHPFLTTKRNKEILEELEIEPAGNKLRRYKSNWLQHVTRMDSSRMAKILLNCRPDGRRRLGRPLKRLLDEAETGLLGSNW